MSSSTRQEYIAMRTIFSLLRALSDAQAKRLALYVVLGVGLSAICRPVSGQPAFNAQQGNAQNALVVPGANNNGPMAFGVPNVNTFGTGTGTGNGRQGGGSANADFESLIDLIQSTVANDTWADNGGGEAEIRPFPTGVLVDAAGTLRLKSGGPTNASRDLTLVRGQAPALTKLRSTLSSDARRASDLRYVSLPRLEREILRRQKAHEPLDASMLTLAGLERVRYVFVYPASGDIVLAGPAGDWKVDSNGRIVSPATGAPVVRLDDLLALMRRGANSADSHFGCAINPRQEALAKTQEFLVVASKKPLEPSQRKKWLSDLRDSVGLQDIQIWGIDPASRLARVMVEADYHMKLVGMGLADGVDGVQSYLASIPTSGSLPPMSVLRWWFALNYDAIHRSSADDAFELVGQGVRVLSENEILAAQGQRVHTNQSEPLNRKFADSFTAHFAELTKKYPVYGELRNVFDLAIAVALIEKEGLAERVSWKPTLLADPEMLRLPAGDVPKTVETVINHRIINKRTFIAGVSGGVLVAPSEVLAKTHEGASDGDLTGQRREAPANLRAGAWWWDAAPPMSVNPAR